MNNNLEEKLAKLKPRVDRDLAAAIFSRTEPLQAEPLQAGPLRTWYGPTMRPVSVKVVLCIGFVGFFLGVFVTHYCMTQFYEMKPIRQTEYRSVPTDRETLVFDEDAPLEVGSLRKKPKTTAESVSERSASGTATLHVRSDQYEIFFEK